MFVDFNILNQLGSPSINSNTFANRPAAGQTGRLFVSTDTFEIYRDNGTTWDLIGGPGSSTITGTGTATQVAYFTSSQAIGSSANLFWDNTNTRLGIGTATPGARLDIHGTGTIQTNNSTGSTNNNYFEFQRAGANVWRIGDTYNSGSNFFGLFNHTISTNAIAVLAATNKTEFTAVQTYTTGLARGNYFDYNLSVSAGGSFSSPNAITALGASLDLTLAGNATIPSGARSGLDAYNSIAFTGAGTLTHGQGTQIRAYSNLTAGWAFNGSATGTITHLAGLRALFPDNTGSAVTVTNNYALLLNDQTANTGTVTYTNRWGVYQEGASDLNYMAANLLLGSTTNNGNKLQVTGNVNITSTLAIGTTTAVAGLLQVNSTDTTTAAHLQLIDPTTTLGNSFVANFRNANDGNGRYSFTAWQVQNASGNDQQIIIGAQSVTGAANYTPNMIFGLRTGATTYAEYMRLNNSGFLGIGTNAPTSIVDVLGGVTSTSDWGNVNITSRNAINAANRIYTALRMQDGVASDAAGIGYSYNGTGYDLEFATVPTIGGALTERMRINSPGRISIGSSSTITDNNLLNIQGSSATDNIGIVLNKTNATAQIWGLVNTGPLDIYNYTSSTNTLRFTTSNNVLIGTTTDAGQKFQVSGDIYTFNSVGGGVLTNQTGNPGIAVSNGYGSLNITKYVISGNNYIQCLLSSGATGGDIVGFVVNANEDGTECQVQLGDVVSFGNGTIINITDSTSTITFTALHNNFANIQQYANNAAALAGGLVQGDIYRITGTGDLKIVI